jgi:hypothetical protein
VLTDRGRDLCDQLTTTYGDAVTEHFAQRLTDMQLDQLSCALEEFLGESPPADPPSGEWPLPK